MNPETSILVIVLAALILFATSVIRYDLVAMIALLACVVAGLVPVDEAFNGFSNPAVITVAAVLIISRGLENAGLVAWLGRLANRVGDRPTAQVAVMTGLTALMSAVINNVGALALMIPVAMDLARRSERSPSYLLMPMAFGSLLGGMTTLIGTPPNLIIAAFRTRYAGESFGMFDFTPAGGAVAVVGVAFISLIGWRLVPRRESQHNRALFEIDKYSAEVFVTDESPVAGQRLNEFSESLSEIDILGVVRDRRSLDLRNRYLRLNAGDVLRLRAEPRDLKELVEKSRLRISGDKPEKLESGDMELVEAVVTPDSMVKGRTARSLHLRYRFGVNMLALSRRRRSYALRLKDVRFKVGDVLLLQIPADKVREVLASLQLLPLAQRDIPLGQTRRLIAALVCFAVAIALSALGFGSTAVCLAGAATILVILNVVSIRDVYSSIDWPIIVLLGAMIPVGGAFESSGAAAALSSWLVDARAFAGPVLLLVILMVVTMFLSDILNNAATAIVMAPVAIGLAENMGVSPDAWLLGVAIASSCAFLTPIGHQSNTLVLGPGGYKFTDYFWLGIWVELLVLATSVPMLLWFWPFEPVAQP